MAWKLTAVAGVTALAATSLIIAVGFVMRTPSNQGVMLILDRTELYSGQHTLKYTIVNNLEEPISFGAAYDVQMLRDGDWVSVEWMKDRVWIMVLYTLRSGESFSGLAELAEDVEPGRYRLVKEVTAENTGRKITLTAEFEVLN
ncbi:hypothetical protein HRbin01_00718 [archaeon HR01]|nr:hypothetical protein HRbin01_00718 [archaeon HR01]